MTPAEYERLGELFNRAVELAPDERPQFLDGECANDAELRRQIESMLEAHEQCEDVDAEGEEDAAGEPGSPGFAELFSGQRIGRYQVLERIGEGGMALVYRAEDVVLERPVALKFLSPSLALSDEARGRFLREAKAAAAIDHPNVCAVHEINVDASQPFIAMALLEGSTLAERLRSDPLEIEAAVDAAIQACRGLEAAHAKGIVHRDIKPSNLMLVPPPSGVGRDQVKILDFGIASYERDKTITQPGAAFGTIAYMSPEQIAAEAVDERTDLWSLGATLYEMLGGRPAFDRPTMRELAAAITGADPVPLSTLRKDVPARLENAVFRLLSKAPRARFPSAAELAAELEEIQRGLLTGKLRAPALRFARPRWWRQAAVAGGIVALGAFAYYAGASREAAAPAQADLLQPRPVTTLPGVEYAAALSPDGQSVAFLWNRGDAGATDVYVQRIGDSEPVRLTQTPQSESSPAWSPDGERIAFLRSDVSDHQILSVPASGGAEELVLAAPGPSRPTYLEWSPAGDLLLLDRGAAIVGIRLADPQAPPIHYEEAGFRGHGPRIDPTGSRIAFFESRTEGAREFVVMPINGDKSAARRYPTDNSPMSFAWSSDGTRLIYVHLREAPFRALRLEDGGIETLPIPPQNAWGPDIRGNRLIYASRVKWDSNIWAADLDTARESGRPVVAQRLIESSKREHGARMSPDGESIVFVSDRSGAMELWRCDRAGNNVKQLTSIGIHDLGSASWSPDGAWIAFDAVLDDRERDIYVVGADGGTPRRVSQSAAQDIIPNWSADGEWIYFASDRAGKLDIWRISPQGGEAERVTTGGGFEAIPTPDGRYLYYSSDGGGPLRRRDLRSGEEVDFPDLGNVRASRFWWPVEDGIYFHDVAAEPGWIQFWDFETRSARRICAFGSRENGPRPVAVSPDGRTLIFTQRDDYDQDILMVEGLEFP